MRTCSRCKETKSFESFYPQKSCRGGISTICKVCSLAYNRRYYLNNREKIIAHQTKTKDPSKYRDWRIKKTYNVTPQEFKEQFDRQNGCCAICWISQEELKYKKLYLDHDHKTGEARGLLCPNCNSALGLIRDNIQTARGLCLYLEITHG